MGEGEGVVGHCEVFDFAEELLDAHVLVLAGEGVVESRGGGVGWEEEGVWEVVPDVEACGLEVHDRADEDDAVKGDAVGGLEFVCETGCACCAVGFSGDVFGA